MGEGGFGFAWPWMALLLPLPWLVRRFLPRRRPVQAEGAGGPVLLHPGVERLEQAFVARQPRLLSLPSWHQLLAVAVWVALVLALMGPQWLERHTQVVSAGYDLMLAVDASRSMEALDFTVEGRRVNRMAVVKGVVGRFVEQRGGDRIGLVVFGDSAHLQAPLTVDGRAVRSMLENVVPRMAGDATAIGDAVGLAVKKLRERPPGSRVLILVTDGESTAGSLPPREAARLAAQYGIRVYTIGVGTKGEVPFMEDGRLIMADMQIDEGLLREIAAVTGGAYFRATDTAALEQIYARIDRLEKSEAETRSTWVPTPLYQWPLGVALAGLLALATVSMWRGEEGMA